MKPFKRGFTLIELLFVLAVLAVITSVVLMSIRNNAQTIRINKAAYEVQQVLQAAMAFRVDQKSWPADLSCNTTDASQNKKFVDDYLPNANVKSIFGSQYCWGAVKTQNLDNTGSNPTQIFKPRFWVAIAVPQKLAKRLSARLPNAIETTDNPSSNPSQPHNQPSTCTVGLPCYVVSEVVEPGEASSASATATGAIVAAGKCVPGSTETNSLSSCKDTSQNDAIEYQIKYNGCGENQQPIVTTALDFLKMPGQSERGWPTMGYSTQTHCTLQTDNDKAQCTLSINYYVDACNHDGCGATPIRTAGDHQGDVGATYNITCAPKAATSNNKWL